VTRPTPVASEQARLILDSETGAGFGTSGITRQAVEAVLLRLFSVMNPLVGAHGFTALVQRAAHLTHQSHACFAALDFRITPNLDLGRLGEAFEQHDAEKAAACAQHLLATLVTLSCSFIGDVLTFSALRRAWPDTAIGKPSKVGEEAQ
jgi:hypothetical protein